MHKDTKRALWCWWARICGWASYLGASVEVVLGDVDVEVDHLAPELIILVADHGEAEVHLGRAGQRPVYPDGGLGLLATQHKVLQDDALGGRHQLQIVERSAGLLVLGEGGRVEEVALLDVALDLIVEQAHEQMRHSAVAERIESRLDGGAHDAVRGQLLGVALRTADVGALVRAQQIDASHRQVSMSIIAQAQVRLLATLVDVCFE